MTPDAPTPAGNAYGDFEITDPRAMRALAHPVRLSILGVLQTGGPSTATRLASVVGATPSVTSWHLRHLAGFGLVRDADPGEDRRQRWWEATSSGFRFSLPDDQAGREAYRLLSGQMFLQYEHLPRQWLEQVEPQLSEQWRRLGGLANTRVEVTAEELEQIEVGFEALLAPYVLRRQQADQTPSEARSVRIMRYALPQGEVPQ